jgi:lipopolysaccharide biosynthesis protein
MFWIRNHALAPFVKLDIGWEDYPAEPVAYDGTMLHALERLFGVVPEKLGFSTTVTNIAGLTR